MYWIILSRNMMMTCLVPKWTIKSYSSKNTNIVNTVTCTHFMVNVGIRIPYFRKHSNVPLWKPSNGILPRKQSLLSREWLLKSSSLNFSFMKVHVSLSLYKTFANFPGKELFYKRSLIINIGLYQSMGWLIDVEILL